MLWKPKQPSFAKQLEIVPPEPHPDRNGLALVLLVKNEAQNLKEWITYHQLVGVKRFFAYDDASTDETRAVLSRHLSGDELTITGWRNPNIKDPRRNRQISNQVLAYAHAISNFGQDFRWMAFIDVDEFILPMGNDTIEQALEPLQDCPNISLPWHMFGRSGHEIPPDEGVLRGYLQRVADPMSDAAGVRNFKCIVDPCRVVEVAIHGFKTAMDGDATWNDAGEKFDSESKKSSDFYSTKRLKLNHYYTKSDSELKKKLARGSASPISSSHHVDRVMKTVGNIERDTVEDLDMFNFVNRRNFRFD